MSGNALHKLTENVLDLLKNKLSFLHTKFYFMSLFCGLQLPHKM